MSYQDANGNGAITQSEIREENNYYPFGLEHKGYNNVVTSTNPAQNYKYNGKELNEELGLGWHDFGFRNYDAGIGRWMNPDPLAEVYIHTSPYGYVENNPVFFIDPDGLRIDVSSILEQDEDGNYVHQELAEAFLAFANSDVGIEFLSKFAEAGQTIGDHTFEEDGEFHSQGIDLAFNATNENYSKGEGSEERGDRGANARTKLSPSPYQFERNGKGTINVNVNKVLNVNNEYAKAYKNDPDNPMAKTLFILSRTLSIFHETIIHADGLAGDLADNCKLDCSNINKNLNTYNDGVQQHIQAKQEGSLFLTKVVPVMKQLYNSFGIKRTNSQIKKQVTNFNN
ncbi:RHS repeat-associated core domain-containing protein [Flavobacteriaceae bacterium M23B6Z8]